MHGIRRAYRWDRLLLASAVLLFLAPGVARAVLLGGVGGAPTCPVFLGPAIIDFDSATPGLQNGTTLQNVTFNGLDFSYNISPAYIGQYNTTGVQSFQSGQPTNPILPSKIEFVFGIPVGAFAFDWGAADNLWKMQAYDSANSLIETDLIALPNSNVNNGEYFGIQAADIKRVLLVDQKDAYPLGDYIFIDDFTYSYETVPEPSGLAMAALSLYAGCIARRVRTEDGGHSSSFRKNTR